MAVACAGNGPSGSDESGVRRTASQRVVALLGGGISSEVLLDNPVSMRLDSGALSVSADPNGFLVTWFDGRETHSGQNTYIGELDHVVATLVSSSGMVANPSGLILSKSMILESNAASKARSAFNGQYYLVAWHKLISSTTNAIGADLTVPSEIDAVRVSTAGEILDATPLALTALPAGDVSTVDVMLSNAGAFFVAWSGQTSTAPGLMQSRTLSLAGSTLVLGPVTTYPFLDSGDPTKYAFAYDGLGYAAAWVNTGNSGFTVGALSHLVTSDCAGTGSSIDAVGLGSNGAGELLVAYAGHVVTASGVCTIGTKVVQIGADGQQKAPPLVLPITPVIIPPLTVSYAYGKYFVAGLQIDPVTNVATPATTSAPSTLACNASTCLTVAGNGVSRLSSTGVRLDDPPIVVSAPARAETAPHVVAGAGEFLALWTEDTDGDNRGTVLHVGRLSSTGASLDPTPSLIAENSFFIDLQFNGTDFVVLWMDGAAHSLHLTRISPAGVVKDPAGILITTLEGSFVNIALACATTECLVTWSATDYSSPPSPVAASATRIAANGTLLDSPPFQVLADAQPLMLKYTGSGYLMQFHSSTLIDGIQVLDTTGHPVGTYTSGNPQTLYPCGSNYVTFTTVPYGNWLRYAVTLLDSSARVLQADLDLGGVAAAQATLPGVASTATGCALAWSQLSGDNQDVYANLINGDGTVALSSPLPIATDHDFNEFGPALAVGADGEILAAYTHFIARAPYGNLRTAARLIAPSAFAPGTTGEGGEGGEGGQSTGTGGTQPAGGASNTAGGTGGSATTGGLAGSTSSAAGGTAAQSGAGGGSSGGAASGGTTHGGAGASSQGATGAYSGQGSGGGGCAMSPRRTPLRHALAVAFMLIAFSRWRRSRRAEPAKN